ncbi:MAG: lytic transglycosylase domain-containing protein [Desulfobaccales bacterium]
MPPSLRLALALGLAGCLVLFFSGSLGERDRAGGDRGVYSRLANPGAGPAGAADQAAGPATLSPGSEAEQAGSQPPAAGPGNGWSPRAPARVVNLARLKELEAVIKKYAEQYGVDEDLVWAVVRQESGFNPSAVSPKGAMGLMQLMPGTAAQLGVSDPFDVEQNIAGGIKYLDHCLNRFNQDVTLALAAYNAGPDNVVKYQGCPPFPETRHYVASILQAYAGEARRDDLRLASLYVPVEEDIPAAVQPTGLPWRVPLPRWKVVTPKCKIESPHWKVSVRPF